jgi:predicted dehydrogenase
MVNLTIGIGCVFRHVQSTTLRPSCRICRSAHRRFIKDIQVKRARIGLLGAGFVADVYMQSFRHVRDCDVAACFSQREERAREFAQMWKIPVHTISIDELIAQPDVDIIVVAVPHHLHASVVPKIAAAGKAVICTKPLGRNAAEARRCLDAVEAAGVWHGYAESQVFDPTTVRAKELADSGALGKVYWVRFREAHAQIHSFARDPETNGGGPMRGLGCHGVAAARWFFTAREPVEVFMWGDRLARDDVQAEDSAVTLIRFDDGSLGQVEVGWGHKAGLDVRAEIHGTDGYVSTDVTGETGMRAFTTSSAGYVIEKAGIDVGWTAPAPHEYITYGFHNAMDHLIHAYLEGRRPWQDFRDGLIDNAIIDAAYRSMESGVWQKIVIPK